MTVAFPDGGMGGFGRGYGLRRGGIDATLLGILSCPEEGMEGKVQIEITYCVS